MRICTLFLLTVAFSLTSCREGKKSVSISAQQIVDSSITASGGDLYRTKNKYFLFRDIRYVSELREEEVVLKRIFYKDSSQIEDIRYKDGFERFVDGNLVEVPDSLATAYSNSINSVHYFAYLPYGLNDRAVNKELMGVEEIKGVPFYKVKIGFDQEGGGSDYEDVYIYWFNKENYKIGYLAYDFHVNGGGIRFREAHNERYVEGIRFVDYRNYSPKKKEKVGIDSIGLYFNSDRLELLSEIDLEQIRITDPPNRS
ncbi:MAG: DUF6503 family protein [Sediminicola sp.]